MINIFKKLFALLIQLQDIIQLRGSKPGVCINRFFGIETKRYKKWDLENGSKSQDMIMAFVISLIDFAHEVQND